MVNITIDGKTIEVPDGMTVLRAAEKAGVKIPTLCDHPELTPYGGCRLCLVEVEGARTLQPSCTLPVSNGMVVRTDTPKIHDARRLVLTLIFSERNHFCPYCQVSGGDCELQNAAYGEGMTHWPLQPTWTGQPMDASHPYIVLEHNRCILCRRCVRACGELVGNFTLGFEERGANSALVADLGVPLGESTCVSCGMCVQVCPTGAIIDRISAYRGRETQVTHNKTVCTGCSVGCSIDVLTRDNNIVRIEGDWDGVINGGVTCKKGRFLPLDERRERIATPMVRKDGQLKAATWEEAIEAISTHLRPMLGKNAVAALASTRLPIEALNLFKQTFAGAFGSTMVTSIEDGITTALPSSLADELGHPFEGKLADIDQADAILDIGVNLVDNHEVAGFMVKRALPRGIKLVVVDPESNAFDGLADIALKVKKGSDAEVINGLAACVIKLGLAKATSPIRPESVLATVEAKTGISIADLETAARMLATAEHPVFIYGKGITSQGNMAALKALVELATLIKATLISTKGEANSLAAAQLHLDQPFKLNAHQAAYVALGDDQPSQRLIQRLNGIPYLVVQASYHSPLTAAADVVLPVENWAEQEGHFLSLDGHLQAAVKAIEARPDTWSNVTVFKALAEKLGFTLKDNWEEELTKRVSPVAILK